MIRPYVESDLTAFYSLDEFDTAYSSLLSFCNLRAESIRKQLNGELSTITDQQNTEDQVDASMINISDTGSMSMSMGNFNFSSDINPANWSGNAE